MFWVFSFSLKLWKRFIQCFNCFPVAAIINDKIFCIHGGLSPECKTIDQIRVFDRRCEPRDGPLSDLIWSDPDDIETWAMSPRGAGWLFGTKVCAEFNYINNLDLIARAH